MKAEILQVLRETDGFVSGQNICRKLAVTRTAVWKAIGQLREEGYVIEAVPNKGYRLKSSPDSISAAEIGSRLTTRWAGLPTVFLKKIDSTNNEAKRRAEKGAVPYLWLRSRMQERGGAEEAGSPRWEARLPCRCY